MLSQYQKLFPNSLVSVLFSRLSREAAEAAASFLTQIASSLQLIAPCSSRKRMYTEVTPSAPTALCSRVPQTDRISLSADK